MKEIKKYTLAPGGLTPTDIINENTVVKYSEIKHLLPEEESIYRQAFKRGETVRYRCTDEPKGRWTTVYLLYALMKVEKRKDIELEIVPREMEKYLKAFDEGKRVQWRCCDGSWVDFDKYLHSLTAVNTWRVLESVFPVNFKNGDMLKNKTFGNIVWVSAVNKGSLRLYGEFGPKEEERKWGLIVVGFDELNEYYRFLLDGEWVEIGN